MKRFGWFHHRRILGKKRDGRRPLRIEGMEPRVALAADIMLDFTGATRSAIDALEDAMPIAGRLADYSRETSFVGEFAALQTQYGGYEAFQFLDFDGDGRLTPDDGDLAAVRILEAVRQDFAPYNVNVSRVDSTADAIPRARANPEGDALVVLTGSHIGNNGQAPFDTNNQSDDAGIVGGSVGLARDMAEGGWLGRRATDAFVGFVSNLVSHEVGHMLGLEHIDTELHPAQRSLMTPTVGAQNLSFPDRWYLTESGQFQNAHQELTEVLGASPRPWAAVLQPGVLTVQGSAFNDTLSIAPKDFGLWTVNTTMNVAGRSLSASYLVDPDSSPDLRSLNPFSTAITQIVMGGAAGNDELWISSSIDASLRAYGGSGNDLIQGGSRNDFLYGQAGADILVGRGGDDELWGDSPMLGFERDLLIGGDGRDTLRGGPGQDLMLAGRTTHDNSRSALFSLMAEWNSSNSAELRIWHLTGFISGGRNAKTVLNASTVLTEGAVDTLYGGSDIDWGFAGPNDILNSILNLTDT